MRLPLLALSLLCLTGCDSVGSDTVVVDASSQPWPAMLDAVNAARAQGQTCGNQVYPPAPPLVWNDRLTAAAEAHSADMARNDYFDHTGRDGSQPGDRVTRAGYSWRIVGENIARYQSSVGEVVDAWVESPSHCRNLMDSRYAELGASERDTYWTQVFGLAR